MEKPDIPSCDNLRGGQVRRAGREGEHGQQIAAVHAHEIIPKL
jgi:hypothetical protein